MTPRPITKILIPMAGRGQRFVDAGFKDPKPFIRFSSGKTLIEMVTENLRPLRHPYQIHYLALAEHLDNPDYNKILNFRSVTRIDQVTEGAACTVLLASDVIDNDQPLILANSDQMVAFDMDNFIDDAIRRDLDGSIVTFTASEKKWSFAKLNDKGLVSEVAEKNPISDIATVGIYYWKHGSDFVKFANQMIQKNIRTNNEFYVCPVFNEAITAGKKIGVYHIQNMYGFGTPEDFVKNAPLFDH